MFVFCAFLLSVVVSPIKQGKNKKGAASNNKQCDVLEIKYSPNGEVVALGCKDNLIHLLSVRSNYKHSAVCRGHSSYVRNIDFSSDGKVMQSCDAAREILFWDALSGQQLTSAEEFRDVDWSSWSCLYGWPVHAICNDESGQTAVEGDVHCVSRSPDGKLVVSGNHHSNVNTLKLFKYPCVGAAIPAVYSGHTSSISDVAFLTGIKADDSKVISIGSADSCVFQWRVVKY